MPRCQLRTLTLGYRAWLELERQRHLRSGEDSRLLPAPAPLDIQSALAAVPAPLVAEVRAARRLKPATRPVAWVAGLVMAVLLLSVLVPALATVATTVAVQPGEVTAGLLFWTLAAWLGYQLGLQGLRLARFLSLLCMLGREVERGLPA